MKYTIKELCENIIKPQEDDRLYRYLVLENGLKVLLVSDGNADKAAASLSVSIGSIHEPTDWCGLAHFLEHMLFLGTEKFPVENEYSSYLNKNGGHSNAYTSGDETNYYFDVAVNGGGEGSDQVLDGALDRFSSFFTCPLLGDGASSTSSSDGSAVEPSGNASNSNAVDREVKAVDSEFKKNLNEDYRRVYQLVKNECDPKHPYNKFDSGNMLSLQQNMNSHAQDGQGSAVSNAMNALKQFYKGAYSSHLMSLCILGRQPLDQLQQMAVKYFSGVQLNLNADQYLSKIPSSHPFDNTQMRGSIIYTCPLKDIRKLTLKFAIPPQYENRWNKSFRYLGHLIGHESTGSILSVLKSLGWATSLSAGVSSHGSKYFDMFSIDISLSVEGLQSYEKVIETVFAYINMLKSEHPFVEYVYQEVRMISDIQFMFAEKSSNASGYVSGLTESMHYYSDRPELLLKGIGYFDEDYQDCQRSVVELFEKYLVPGNFCAVVLSKECPQSLQQQMAQTTKKNEKWYGTEYSVMQLDRQFLSLLNSVKSSQNLSIPRPNPFMPKDLSLCIEPQDGLQHPLIVRESPLMRTWYRLPSKSIPVLPKMIICMNVKSQQAYQPSPFNSICSYLICQMVHEELAELSYEAECALISWQIDATAEGFSLLFGGVGKGIIGLMEIVLKTLRNYSDVFSDTKDQTMHQKRLKTFEVLKDKYKRSLMSFGKEQSYQHAIYYTTQIIQSLLWTHEDKLNILESVRYDDLVKFSRHQLWQNIYTESWCFGNVTKQEVVTISTKAEEILSNASPSNNGAALQSLPLSVKSGVRSHLIPPAKTILHVKSCANHLNPNYAIELFYQCGPLMSQMDQYSVRNELELGANADPHVRCIVFLLVQMMQEAAFNQLRTKEQLGYIVFTSMRKSVGSIGLRVIVQSERDSSYLEQRIENFLLDFGRQHLKIGMDNEESGIDQQLFSKYVQSCINVITQKDENMMAESTRYWKHISGGYYEFNQVDVDVAALKAITPEHLVEFYTTYIDPNSPYRSKLVTHIRSVHPLCKQFGIKDAEVRCDSLLASGVQQILADEHDTFVSSEEIGILIDQMNLGHDVNDAGQNLEVEDLAKKVATKYGTDLILKRRLKENTVLVDDVDRIKSLLSLGPCALPVKPSYLKTSQQENGSIAQKAHL
ncbi:hypothetical protein MIR68_001121 [Amoeboaphelidium protococcarum]|nr:hypothetical protein MIR68_001121 [Amoeboaphelidium protococcarum]